MATASGIEKKLILAPQAAQGTVAVANLNTAQYLRRVTSNFSMTKETFQSNEMRADRQIGDMRHGVQSVDGSISGELSLGTYQRLQAAILRKAWAAGATTGAVANVTSAVTTGAAGTFTRAAGTYLTAGLKIGDVVRWTGFTGDGAPNNVHNFLITALTALVMTGVMLDGVPVGAVAMAAVEVTGTVVGKKLWTPATAHTEDWFSVEEYFSDLDLSEVTWDLKPNTMAVKLPASGLATIDFGMMGLRQNRLLTGTSPFFSAVLAASAGGVLAAVNGALYVAGTKIALLTGLDFDVAAGLTSEGVVGSNYKPDLFDGRVQVKGNMSLFFEDATMRDYFVDETEVSIICAFTDSNLPAAGVMAFTMPRVKMGGASKDDGEKGIIQTMPFVALFNAAGDDGVTTTKNSLATTLSIQDSTVA